MFLTMTTVFTAADVVDDVADGVRVTTAPPMPTVKPAPPPLPLPSRLPPIMPLSAVVTVASDVVDVVVVVDDDDDDDDGAAAGPYNCTAPDFTAPDKVIENVS
jgi:hypothetical protein